MSRIVKSILTWKSLPILLPSIVLLGLGPIALAKLNKDTVAVPGGLAFSEFKGYEQWEFISLSHGEKVVAAIVGNPAMIEAFKSGIPANGKQFPDGAKMAKIHWLPTKMEDAPGQPTVPGTLHDVDFMVKDSKRFADSGGWGYAQFEYDQTKDEFRPGTVNDIPPQENDAKCGFACHTLVESKDYVFTSYQKR
ncbi:cytochrome P460 family protein [Hyphomicrobium sp.]|uniref:cytochrome P460 family protein n=1 Tax=Hyphomicrobium sp. TaxID=82 RepID=UPI000F94ACB8|nr:cytochrome P460 family protein [Hyphomicrobium sp.]RUP09185.1 MAG: cytochrome P460 [Hyphomicrobium sp.]